MIDLSVLAEIYGQRAGEAPALRQDFRDPSRDCQPGSGAATYH